MGFKADVPSTHRYVCLIFLHALSMHFPPKKLTLLPFLDKIMTDILHMPLPAPTFY